jgi:ATP-binding cassette subfamily F protein uup
MDTLDILQDYLEAYQGTLIVVSHDRDFLDNIATSILAFEGNGIINQHLGGYSDYLEFKQKNHQKINALDNRETSLKDSKNKEKQIDKNKNFLNNQPIIFTYKMALEQEKINEKITKLNQNISQLSAELQNCDNYNPNDFANINLEISKYQNEIQKLENRWLELEEIREKNSD